MKRSLLEELNNIRQKKAVLELEISRIKASYVFINVAESELLPASVGSLAVLEQASKKVDTTNVFASKKPTDEETNYLRLANFMKRCSDIHKKLTKDKSLSQFFTEPVDVVRYNIPDYFNVIKHPMDLGTIKSKLQQNKYKSPLEFRDDVRLVFMNCRTYNSPGHDVWNAGDKLSEKFEKWWHESRTEEDWLRAPMGAQGPGTPSTQSAQGVARALDQAAQSGGTAMAPAHQSLPSTVNELTFAEKRKLGVQLSALQGDDLEYILTEFMPPITGTDNPEEVEMDVESFDNATLVKIKQYVDGLQARGRIHVEGAKAGFLK